MDLACLERRVGAGQLEGTLQTTLARHLAAKTSIGALWCDDGLYRGASAPDGRCGKRARFRRGATTARPHQSDQGRSKCCRGCAGRYDGSCSAAARHDGAWDEPPAAGYAARMEAAAQTGPHDVWPQAKRGQSTHRPSPPPRSQKLKRGRWHPATAAVLRSSQKMMQYGG